MLRNLILKNPIVDPILGRHASVAPPSPESATELLNIFQRTYRDVKKGLAVVSNSVTDEMKSIIVQYHLKGMHGGV